MTRRELAQRVLETAPPGSLEYRLAQCVLRKHKLGPDDLARARDLRSTGMGWKQVAAELGVSLATLGRERKMEAGR
jgi:DNA invertase Pin-like site-specific DNA recombinase